MSAMKQLHVFLATFLMTVALRALEIHGAVVTSRRSSHTRGQTFLSSNATVEKAQVIRQFKKSVLKKNAEIKHGHFTDSLKCGVTVKVGMNSDKDEECPSSCPYFAQDKSDDEHCTYVCVKAEECPIRNENRPIASTIENKFGVARKICRAPYVHHCMQHTKDGTDTCEKCHKGYYLNTDGGCTYEYLFVVWFLVALGVVLLVVIIVWLADMASRPNKNNGAVNNALDNRGRAKLHRPREENDTSSTSWPLNTNLLQTVVAGPGILLHFNFIFMSMVWAVLVCLCWVGFAVFHNELFILGRRQFGTPRENCILVAWGYHTQQRLMWTKVSFLIIVYFLSFVGSLIHSIRQLRIFQNIHRKTSSMNDFVALLSGLPHVSGNGLVEDDLKKAMLSKAGIENLVGVSICWDYEDPKKIELVQKAVEEDVIKREKKIDSRIEDPPDASNEPKPNALRKIFLSTELQIFGTPGGTAGKEPDLQKELEGMNSTDRAFAVFETEEARNAAIRAGSFDFTYGDETRTIEVSYILCEPDTVYWGNLGADKKHRILRGLLGLGKFVLALIFWTLCFYCPYAWSVFTWNYDNGIEPPAIYGFAFSMVVVAGNAIMYQVCSDIADGIRFFYRDDRECFYMISYLIACSFNIAVDAVSTYFMSFYIMTGLHFRTYDGTRLEQVATFTERFETYAVQRHLAESVYAYAWPSTFLVPFLIEPFPTILLPLYVGMLVVAKNPAIRGRDAQADLASFPMDLGRYSDILLNMLLGVLIFYMPGGYTTDLFIFMALSHVYIYAFDHWKVLRNIPQCTYVSMEIDTFAQLAFTPINGVILSCLVFKMNGEHYAGFDLEGMRLVLACTGACLLHTLVHSALILKVVPMFGKEDEGRHMPNATYKEVNKVNGCSWFTANPVHCLRSKYIYKHSPPCVYYVAGRDHLLEVNEDIGCYFTQQPPETEDFTLRGQLETGKQLLSRVASRLGSMNEKADEEPTEEKADEER